MPTYEFRCPNGHGFDRFFRTISAGVAELPCPECGAVAVRQLSAGAGLHFKGSGFYLTDYGKNAHRKPESAKKEDSAKAEGAKPEGVKPDATKAEGATGAGGAAPKSEAKSESSKPKEASPSSRNRPKPKSE